MHTPLTFQLHLCVWRLRGLARMQSVRFIVSQEVAEIICQKLKLAKETPVQFDSILAFVIANQAQQQGKDNYKALTQALETTPQRILLKVLLHPRLDPRARLQAFNFKLLKKVAQKA